MLDNHCRDVTPINEKMLGMLFRGSYHNKTCSNHSFTRNKNHKAPSKPPSERNVGGSFLGLHPVLSSCSVRRTSFYFMLRPNKIHEGCFRGVVYLILIFITTNIVDMFDCPSDFTLIWNHAIVQSWWGSAVFTSNLKKT